MKVYKIQTGILVEERNTYYILEDEDWDSFINDDNLYKKIEDLISSKEPEENGANLIQGALDAPIESQEIWASGVTYYNSKLGREEESRDAGGANFYARVYDAKRPELFFKANKHRTVAPGGYIRIREDSSWDVPEPELTLVITSSGKIVGYTIGNDVSSRSIEGENPLYLPQAKCYDGSAAIGPCILVADGPLPTDTVIRMEVKRQGDVAFEDQITVKQIKRKLSDLVHYLYKECSFPCGCLLMTGTGIVPSRDFTLQEGDEVRITIPPIGTLINRVK